MNSGHNISIKPRMSREGSTSDSKLNKQTNSARSSRSLEGDHVSFRSKAPLVSIIKKPKIWIALCIVGWYLSSTTLSVFNKWLFGQTNQNFGFPLMATSIHMFIQFFLAAIVLWKVVPRFRPRRYPPMKDYLSKVLPCALASGLDIGLSNASQKTLSLSFYTMVKAGSPCFVLLFAFLFRLEKPTWALTAIISVISFGVLLTVVDHKDDGDFALSGFLEVFSATIFAGLRWSLVQILLEKEHLGMNNPFATMFFLSPLMSFSLLSASSILEGLGNLAHSHHFATLTSSLSILGLCCLGGVLAFIMVSFEFFLISATSVVTLSVVGIFKEILTILVAHVIFKDKFSTTSIVGLCISLVGIIGYNWLRVRKLRHEAGDDGDVPGIVGYQPISATVMNRESESEGFDELDEEDFISDEGDLAFMWEKEIDSETR